MELIKNLDELEIGDFVKVYPKDTERYPFKIGEVTHKWQEKNNPCFELKIFRTNLPLTTEQIVKKFWETKGIKKDYKKSKCGNDEERVFKLNEEEKSTLLKKMILKEL